MIKLLIALPVYNEEKVLAQSARALILALNRFELLENSLVVIVDNASTDKTSQIAKGLAREIPQVTYLYESKQGKGGAIRAAWNAYPAEIACFMDIDLSTDLEALPRLVAAMKDGADLAYGSRFMAASIAKRSWQRKILAGGYYFLVKTMFGFDDDINCGFKAVSRSVIERVLPLVKNDQFFFDTELLLRARAQGLKLVGIPVEWVEKRFPGRKSTVRIFRTVLDDLKNLWQLHQRLKK